MNQNEIKKIKIKSKSGMIIVDVTVNKPMTHPIVHKIYETRQIVRHNSSIGMPFYKSAKKVVSDIAKDTGVELSVHFVGGSLSGVYPPIGIRVNGKVVKIIKKYGK